MKTFGKENEVSGHKTFSDGRGGFCHELLTREEADALWLRIEQNRERRKEKYPTEQECVEAIFEACTRLEELGWKPARYAPADGKTKCTISLGTTGIHAAYCVSSPSHKNENWWWTRHDGDIWPIEPIYYKDDMNEHSTDRCAV